MNHHVAYGPDGAVAVYRDSMSVGAGHGVATRVIIRFYVVDLKILQPEILRIAALYTDLTASWTGAVTRKQMYDRVAITWQAVPEYSYAATNTFQIEMFFDGRIRLSWLEINADECIVGLSNGRGLPEGFVQTDFTGVFLEASEPSPASVPDSGC